MTYQQIQEHTNKIINSRLITGDYSVLTNKWFTNNNADDFANMWVIVKNTTTLQSNMYCGKNVLWRNTCFNIPSIMPNFILVIENSVGKGILIQKDIMDLIQLGDMGIFLWVTPIPISKTNQTLLQFMHASTPIQSGGVCINAGGTLMQLPAGGTIQFINHSAIINTIQPLGNISHFRLIRKG
jgi:hypothetical protein